MQDLAAFLESERKRIGYRELVEKTGVSKGSLENLIQRTNIKLPELETLQRIAEAYKKPLWEVVEMAGVNLQLPHGAREDSARLTSLVEAYPMLRTLIVRLLELYAINADVVTGMLIAIDAVMGPGTQDKK